MEDPEFSGDPRSPNLFVVGAPKCGTTSLCHYLDAHPDVLISEQKEPLYFCSDQVHTEPWKVDRAEAYLAQFAGGEGLRWRGEGSVWYLSSETAARRIQAVSPDARIVIMLRNPVDLAVSLHAQFLFSGNENIASFEEAYVAQAERRRGERIPWRAHAPGGLLYTDIGLYAPQIERYLALFPREQIQILIFEDFFRDTAAGFSDVCAFLGLPKAPDARFEASNARHVVRNVRLQRFLTKVPEVWEAANRLPAGFLRQAAGRPLKRLQERLLARNASGNRRMLPLALRRRLHDDFAADIAQVETLIGRDLRVWRDRNLGVGEAPAAAG